MERPYIWLFSDLELRTKIQQMLNCFLKDCSTGKIPDAWQIKWAKLSQNWQHLYVCLCTLPVMISLINWYWDTVWLSLCIFASFSRKGFWATSQHSPFYRSSTGKPIGNVTISVPIDERYVYIDMVNRLRLRRHKSFKMNFICEQSAGISTCINESIVWAWNFEKRFNTCNVIRKLKIKRIYMHI